MQSTCPQCGNHDVIYQRTDRLVCRPCAGGEG